MLSVLNETQKNSDPNTFGHLKRPKMLVSQSFCGPKYSVDEISCSKETPQENCASVCKVSSWNILHRKRMRRKSNSAKHHEGFSNKFILAIIPIIFNNKNHEIEISDKDPCKKLKWIIMGKIHKTTARNVNWLSSIVVQTFSKMHKIPWKNVQKFLSENSLVQNFLHLM